MSKEKMIMFTGDMVRAILDGSKTQTRRPARKIPLDACMVTLHDNDYSVEELRGKVSWFGPAGGDYWPCNREDVFNPSLQPGDTMLVRERARLNNYTWGDDGRYDEVCFDYEADNTLSEWVKFPKRLKMIYQGNCVPNGCFKELVRIKRKVVRVWFERVQDISDLEARLEGIDRDSAYECNGWCPSGTDPDSGGEPDYRMGFRWLWESIYPGSWERNDWCESIEFEGPEKAGE